MTSFWRLSSEKETIRKSWQWRYVLFMSFPVIWMLLMLLKFFNKTSNKGLSHYFSKKATDFKRRKSLKVRLIIFFLIDDIIKNNTDAIILIKWLMFKFLLKSKDVLHQVSSDMGEVNSFYSSFSDAGKKAPCLSKVRKSLPSISKKLRRNKEGYHHLSSPSTYLSTEFRNKETSSISYHP